MDDAALEPQGIADRTTGELITADRHSHLRPGSGNLAPCLMRSPVWTCVTRLSQPTGFGLRCDRGPIVSCYTFRRLSRWTIRLTAASFTVLGAGPVTSAGEISPR